jgi:hypothetical protein
MLTSIVILQVPYSTYQINNINTFRTAIREKQLKFHICIELNRSRLIFQLFLYHKRRSIDNQYSSSTRNTCAVA